MKRYNLSLLITKITKKQKQRGIIIKDKSTLTSDHCFNILSFANIYEALIIIKIQENSFLSWIENR